MIDDASEDSDSSLLIFYKYKYKIKNPTKLIAGLLFNFLTLGITTSYILPYLMDDYPRV